MCGRYVLEIKPSFNQRFELEDSVINFTSKYNISPGQQNPVIINLNNQKTLQLMNWGLSPPWLQEKSPYKSLFNARADSVTRKLTFSDSVRQRRCLVPASGFYEWQQEANTKQPYYFYPKDIDYISFAGIFDTSGSYTIITTKPNPSVEPIHHRMPLILSTKDESLWLNNNSDWENILSQTPSIELARHPVSLSVNSSGIDSPELIKPL